MGLENVLIGHLSANPGKGFYSNIFAFFAGFVQIKSYLSSGIRSMTIMREGRNDISMCVFYLLPVLQGDIRGEVAFWKNSGEYAGGALESRKGCGICVAQFRMERQRI